MKTNETMTVSRYSIKASITYLPDFSGILSNMKHVTAIASIYLMMLLMFAGVAIAGLKGISRTLHVEAAENIVGIEEDNYSSEEEKLKKENGTKTIIDPNLIYDSEEDLYIALPVPCETEEEVEEEQTQRYYPTDDEYLALSQIVEAEVTGDFKNSYISYDDGLMAKVHVTQVILNRVEDSRFPDNILDVIYQKDAFTPVSDGRMWEVEVTSTTREAIDLALKSDTPDYTYEALYFRSDSTSCEYGYWLFTDAVGHSFFHSY